MMNFSQLLEAKYLEWRQKSGEPKTLTEFADWLGLPISTISTWRAKKSKPSDETIIRRLALKLGMDVYDALDLKRPDIRLLFINENWDVAPEELQGSIFDQLEQGINKNDVQRVQSKQKKKRTQ